MSDTKKNRTAIPIIVGVAVIMLVIGVAIGSIGFPMTTTETEQIYELINPQVTVTGVASGFPCGALGFVPCVTYPNQSVTAELIMYAGNYYYLSFWNDTANGLLTTYTIWYDNTTVYCVSPKVQSQNLCPTTPISTATQTITVTALSPNANLTTLTRSCTICCCDITSAYTYGNNTTTVVVFMVVGLNTTSYYTETLSHSTT